MVGEFSGDVLHLYISDAVAAQNHFGGHGAGTAPAAGNLGILLKGGIYPVLGPYAQKQRGYHQNDIVGINSDLLSPAGTGFTIFP